LKKFANANRAYKLIKFAFVLTFDVEKPITKDRGYFHTLDVIFSLKRPNYSHSNAKVKKLARLIYLFLYDLSMPSPIYDWGELLLTSFVIGGLKHGQHNTRCI